ncbi:DUF1850 domain-containing protein [Caldalkalibacillus mannanilyticus]|uniref:DUF1850 domain-containing protein n=1 Tax=Caldalkalibacillus mannanilyticus TaxID=1418 RepID=UPI0009E09671|nr:DUF1850 domain-containing protein [Caldalkalibacillus mannanilyticus]
MRNVTSTMFSQRVYLYGFALLLLLAIALLGFFLQASAHHSGQKLIIQHQKTAEIYNQIDIERGDRIEVAWIHSVEKTPWSEIFEVTHEGQLQLIETRFQSFGAGVPHLALSEDMHTEDGYTVITGFSHILPHYRWIHSQQAEFSISINGERIMAPHDLPHHHPIEMCIEKR